MKNRFKEYKYTITTDPEDLNAAAGIPEELYRQMYDLHKRALKGGKKNIEKLTRYIRQYPGVPQLKNFLSVAWMKTGNIEKAREINRHIVQEHPDYLFGRLNLAFEYYDKEQYEKIPEVVGEMMEIQELYPDRDCFHLSEVTGFYRLAIMYFCAIGNLEAAESRYEILREIAPSHPDTEEVYPYIMKAYLKAGLKRMEEENKTRISVKTVKHNKVIQRETKPDFINREIDWLYENGLRIEKEKLEIILNLPRGSLVPDLKLILKDSVFRYEYFKRLTEKSKNWPENRMSFPIHAIYILGELKASEALVDILETLRQEEDFIEFWYGDFMTNGLWEPLYYLSENNLETLKDFVLTPNIWTYARSEIACCVSQIGLHQPERKGEVIKWFRDIFNHLAGASLEDEIIDSDFIGMAISDVLDLRASELLPEIKKLFDLGYVNRMICGDFNDVEKEIYEPCKDFFKKELLNIYDRYHQITATWHPYPEKNLSSASTNELLKVDQKPGRNDPCPCGSGKKYKNCCLNNKS